MRGRRQTAPNFAQNPLLARRNPLAPDPFMDDEISRDSPRHPGEADPREAESAAIAGPLPAIRSVMLAGIFVLMVLYTLYATAELAIPLVFALLLKMLLQPGVRLLGRLHLPQALAALIMIALVFGALGGAGYMLAGPAASWAQKAPQGLPRLEQRLSVLKQPIDRLSAAAQDVEHLTEAPGAPPSVAVSSGPGLMGVLFSGTRRLLTGLGITVLLLFFLLASGDLFMRRLVEILPSFRDKRQAVAIAHEVESNISAYLVTITVMNLLVGAAAGCSMWLIGLPDPLLWGALAFILNYVLILGPLTGICLFFLIGLLTFGTLWQALLPPAAYLAIHLIEGEAVTPMLVARRLTLNPVLVIGSLIFWDWMWGIPGALLAVPMLAVAKIICDRIRPLAPIGHFMGG
jgi:predicted PurR-regulated permease PerM